MLFFFFKDVEGHGAMVRLALTLMVLACSWGCERLLRVVVGAEERRLRIQRVFKHRSKRSKTVANLPPLSRSLKPMDGH